MPGLLHRYIKDRRGTTFEGIALSVSIVAVAFVASADMLDYMVKKDGKDQPIVVAEPSSTSPARKDLDNTPTASLPKLVSRSTLNPCTGITKLAQ